MGSEMCIRDRVDTEVVNRLLGVFWLVRLNCRVDGRVDGLSGGLGRLWSHGRSWKINKHVARSRLIKKSKAFVLNICKSTNLIKVVAWGSQERLDRHKRPSQRTQGAVVLLTKYLLSRSKSDRDRQLPHFLNLP